jgi:hypothetical protein
LQQVKAMADHLNFADVQKKLIQAKREILVLLPNQAQNYFVKSFTDQGMDGKPWKEVQRRIPGDKAYKYPKTKGLQRQTSPILVGAGWKKRGGTLRRAVSTMARTSILYESGFKMIVDLPYASIQNDGGIISQSAREAVINFKTDKKGKTRFSTAKKATHAQKVTIGSHTIKIDARPFVKQTPELTEMQTKKINKIITKIF